MTWFGFLFLFGLALFPCQGVIYPLSGKESLTFLPGSTGKIEWSFDDNISDVFLRSWTFTSTGSVTTKVIATLSDDGDPTIRLKFPVFAVEKPATLVLNNVDHRYDGKYKFQVQASTGESFSEITVFIAEKPNVTLNCSSPVPLLKDDNFTCLCRGEGGNPPANVTWFKDGKKFTVVGEEMQILNLFNVSREDNGTYKCEATSYPHKNYTDEESIKVTVYYKPVGTTIQFSSFPAVINQSLTVTCLSYGLPDPNITIFHNGTKVASGMTYNISRVNRTHAGTYKCVAKNYLGNDSFSIFLHVDGTKPTTPPLAIMSSSAMKPSTLAIQPSSTISAIPSSSTQSSNGGGNKRDDHEDDDDEDGDSGDLSTEKIVGIVVGVVAFLVLICCLILYCKYKERDNKSDVNPNGSKVITNHYELEEDQLEGGGNTYDTAKPPDKGEGSQNNAEQKPPGDSLPPVYASVNKENRQGNTLYASLDSEALKRPSQKKPAENQPKNVPTEYASIDFMKTAKTPNDDSVST